VKNKNGTDTVYKMELFRNLSESEIQDFRNWARDNYKPLSEIKGVWHPIVQDECVKMNEEASKDLEGLLGDFIESSNDDTD
jgi:hypothetical protein